MLPRVKIYFENGALGRVLASSDGVMGALCTGVAVSTTFALGTAYAIRKFADLETELGITAENNANIVKLVSEFYSEAPDGTKLWLMGFANTVTLAQMVDKDLTNGKNLLLAAQGEIKGLLVSRTPAAQYSPTITAGLDADVAAALTKAQALAEYAAETLFAPIFVVLEGRSFSGTPADLTDMTDGSDNRVSILIGDTADDSGDAAVGLLGGRIAAIPVSRKISRVRDGALSCDAAYIKDKKAELADVESIHDKGYITFRTFVGRSGYFFSDDPTCTLPTDDYNSLTARRTVDKAYRIAYNTLLNDLSDEVPVNGDGTIAVTKAKTFETNVENAIINSMTASGELGNDPGNPADTGVVAFIDHSQNLVSTGRLVMTLRVKPYGYPKYIDVNLGFQTISG